MAGAGKMVDNQSFCVYPWINLHTSTEGRCKLCCHIYSEDYIKINGADAILGKDEWHDIWHGDYMMSVREKMIGGLPVKECQRCYDHESKGLESSRQWANKTYAIDSLEVYDPTHLELRLGNHCNLKCNSCWGPSSDSLYKERKNILSTSQVPIWLKDQWNHEISTVERFDWRWFETEKFKNFVNHVSLKLKRLYLTGGEPTLINANRFVLDQLIKSNNKSCYVCWTTNLTSWPKEFYDKLDFFNNSEIQVSIDGYGNHNRYIRYPTDWTRLELNFQKCINLPEKVKIKIYFVLQAWNVFDVRPLIEWLENKNRNIDFVPIFLESPDFLHSCVWPQDVKSRVLDQLSKIKTERHIDAVNKIKNYLINTNKYSKEKINKMKEYISIIDQHRKYQFYDEFSELKEIINSL